MPSSVGARAAYSCEVPGKLVRPRLLVCTAAGLGLQPDDSGLLDVAEAIEMGHVASLIHDDIIDGSPLRRGRSALHTKFGAATAIITGDAMLFSMFRGLSSACPPDVATQIVRTIADMGTRLCEGEHLEEAATRSATTAVRSQEALSLATYMRVIRNKTASYFVAMCDIAVAMAPGGFEARDDLLKMAELFGMAFQVRDDLLRVLPSSVPAGKPLGIDESNGLVTAFDLHGAGFDLFEAVREYVNNGGVEETSAAVRPRREVQRPQAQEVDILLKKFRRELVQRVDALPCHAKGAGCLSRISSGRHCDSVVRISRDGRSADDAAAQLHRRRPPL
ncbi:polyprenyl synthetase family protein [Actinomyces wuliandei]|nr:polyprenyl synthetase family protein [Actinomyces wuliandei]